MNKADRKVEEYLKRADNILIIIDGELKGSLSSITKDPMILTIEIAKMIQKESEEK